MKNRHLIAVLLASIGLSIFSICDLATAQTTANPVNDEALVTSVKTALAAKPELNTNEIQITSKNGEVTLAGPVEDGRQLYQIGMTVQNVQGVKYVINEMMPKHQ